MRTFIVFLGPPGAGKGTQAKLLMASLGVPQVSTGDLFRAMKAQDTPLAHRVQEFMARGALVPDDLTIQMVKERLSEPDCARGCLLDGFPRTVAQAEALDRLLADAFNDRVSVVPFLWIDQAEAVRRIAGRRSCPTCGRIYHIDNDPPRRDGFCDNDGAALIQRDDDRPEIVAQRYQVYLDNTAPLIGYYRDHGLLVEVNAVQPVAQVTVELTEAIYRALSAR